MKKNIQFQKLNHFMISLQPKPKSYFNCFQKLLSTPSIFYYSIEATLAFQSGQPIILPSSVFKDIHAKLQQQLVQNIKYKVTFLFVENNLRLLYKTNIVKKKQVYHKKNGNININSQQIFPLQNNQQNKYFQNLTFKEKTIFQIYLKQLYAYIINLTSFAGIPLYKKSILSSNKILNNKTFHEEHLKQTLSFRSKLSELSNKKCQISLFNIGLSTIKMQVKYYSGLTKQINQQLQQTLDLLIPKQKNCVSSSNLYKITYINEQNCNLAIVGGVSTVQKTKVQKMIYHQFQSDMSEQMLVQNTLLAKKILQKHSHIQKNQQNTIKRFKHQLNIIKQINQKNHYKFYMLNYYYSLNTINNTIDDNIYYLDWQQISLSFYLQKYQSKLSMQDKLFLAIQIVLIIIDLHYCGIVHRDLKPSNFLVDIKIKDGILLPRLKLIDFSDSMIIKNKGAEVKVGQLKVYSTSAYCPLQTSTSHQNYLTEGLIKPQIDYWSVGIILYQIFFGTLPVSYSSSTAKDIHALWKYQFNQQMYRQKHEGVESIKNIISFLSFQLIKFNPQERLPLKNVLAILLCTKKYYTYLKTNFIKYTN